MHWKGNGQKLEAYLRIGTCPLCHRQSRKLWHHWLDLKAWLQQKQLHQMRHLQEEIHFMPLALQTGYKLMVSLPSLCQHHALFVSLLEVEACASCTWGSSSSDDGLVYRSDTHLKSYRLSVDDCRIATPGQSLKWRFQDGRLQDPRLHVQRIPANTPSILARARMVSSASLSDISITISTRDSCKYTDTI